MWILLSVVTLTDTSGLSSRSVHPFVQFSFQFGYLFLFAYSCVMFSIRVVQVDTPWWFRSEFNAKKTYNNYALSLSLQDMAMMSLAKELLIL